ncbi:putative B mating type protein [Heterobasidion irregulare TC 32-1]|uniref:Putative B mating type protein n=1 Tax=Heterobasidion irregulare (strain TC 32-1) TaxID=747525 RepID=W4K3R1_HETIT|nr:putative B mating type protein [Heterobasidion irregulare TC 32-1]ETW79706.1 putative B mating type protein [Heterobasidion irregulare TC 32-1]
MRTELSAFSFLSIFFLLLISPSQWKSASVPNILTIAWLLVCNIIHAVNSSIWAGNVFVHVPIWCDIATKVLLGVMIAVPGAFLCLCRRLERISSRDETRLKGNKQHTRVFEAFLCLFLPVVYMALHVIVQDHRFDIVEDFGCQPATFMSLPALIIVWLPPLVISVVALLYCVSASINVAKSRYNSWPLFPSAPEMSLSLFVRRVVFGVTGMTYTVVVYVFISSTVTLSAWSSISDVHAQFSKIEILPLGSAAGTQNELIWWAIPLWTILICITFAFEEEMAQNYRSLINWSFRRIVGRDILSVRSKYDDMITTTSTTPIHLLKSGWDDTLNTKSSIFTLKQKRSVFAQNTSALTLSTLSPPASPEADASFTQSTLTYLESDTARQLCLPSPPPTSQSQIHSSSTSSPIDTQDRVIIPPSHSTEAPIPTSPSESMLSSAAWPEPPRTIPSPQRIAPSSADTRANASSVAGPASAFSHPYAYATPSSPTRSASSALSAMSSGRLDLFGYPLLPIARPAHQMRDIPLNVAGPSMMPIPNPNPLPRRYASVPRSTREHQHRSSKKARKLAGIHMTVVKETV